MEARQAGATGARLAAAAVDRAWAAGEQAARSELREIARLAPAVERAAATVPTLGPVYGPQPTPLDVVRHGMPNRRALPAARAAVEQATAVLVEGVRQAAGEMAVRTAGQYEAIVREAARAQLAEEANSLQVQQRALDGWARKGLPAFTDNAGRTWSNQAYSEMLTRTVTQRAYTDAAHATLAAEGFDLVIVSSHRNPADVCQPYERKVLSMSGRSGIVRIPSALTGELVTVDVYSTYDAAVARGYKHPGCRHIETAFVPDVTRPGGTEPNPAGYAATQEQRHMERKIREWKRREAVAGSDEDRKYAKAKIREWQARTREHVKVHGLDRRYYRETPRVGAA